MNTLSLALPLLVELIFVALVFDFLNGLHDAANSIATVVSTRVLPPLWAVAWASFLNFIAFLFFGLHVANTVGTGIVSAVVIDPRVVFGALTGAISWNIITWSAGIPSSSSHALIGGLVGAGIAKAGMGAILWYELGPPALACLFTSPGLSLALLMVLIVSWSFFARTPLKPIAFFAKANCFQQHSIRLVMVAMTAEDNGSHCRFTLLAGDYGQRILPTILGGSFMPGRDSPRHISGGWRIVRTMGMRITHLTPMLGFCAETGGGATLFLTASFGIPVSTTHTITGAIIGVGASRKISAVRWGVAREIVIAWVLTMPASGLLASLFYFVSGLFG